MNKSIRIEPKTECKIEIRKQTMTMDVDELPGSKGQPTY